MVGIDKQTKKKMQKPSQIREGSPSRLVQQRGEEVTADCIQEVARAKTQIDAERKHTDTLPLMQTNQSQKPYEFRYDTNDTTKKTTEQERRHRIAKSRVIPRRSMKVGRLGSPHYLAALISLAMSPT